MKIGVVVATKEERGAFYGAFRASFYDYCMDKYEIMVFKLGPDKIIYLILSGVGEIAAAASTQYLIDKFNVDKIINCGVAGSLSDQHPPHTVGFVRKVVHYDFDLSAEQPYLVGQYPGEDSQFLVPDSEAIYRLDTLGIKELICASGDKFIDGTEAKSKLRNDFGADICDMEAAGVVITCNRNRVPCTLIKSVSDGWDGGISEFSGNAASAAIKCMQLVSSVI